MIDIDSHLGFMLMTLRARVILALASFVVAAAPLRAQDSVPADTAARDTAGVQIGPRRVPPSGAVQLPTVTVTRQTEPRDRAPVAVDVIGRDEIRRGQLTVGLDEALASVPGVYVANRYNFSLDQRLSIRGFGSRANFGVRGVKVLLDGVPQTLPDGQSQLTNVEFGALDRIEVLRGPSSSLYGNASGGVISLHSEAAAAEPFAARLRAEYGKFGTDKWQLFTSARRGSLSGTLSLSRFTTTGFRQQSAADLRQLNLTAQYAASGSTLFGFRFAAADNPVAQNPGALVRAELLANRDSAAANNILRRADKDVQQQQLSLDVRHVDGAGNEYAAVLFGLLRDLKNPLATPPPGPPSPAVGTFVAIDRQVGGVRLTTTRRLGAAPTLPRLTAGADVQRLRDDRRNFRAERGVPTDSLLIDQRETVLELGAFAQLTWAPTERLLVSGGGRYDAVDFDVSDRHLTDGVDNTGGRTMDAVSGNVGASYVVHPAFVPYVNVSTAFETPTTTELANRPNDAGGFNDRLDPQHATNIELGARGRVGAYVTYSATVFRSHVTDAIVQFREVSGRAFFQNAGRTKNDGLELGVTVTPIPALRVFGSYTFADYTFDEYRIVNGAAIDTLDGNRLAGIPRHFARLGVRAEPGYGLAIDLDQTIGSSLFADDANTVGIDGWDAGVTNVRVSWVGVLGRTTVAPFVGLNNIFDRDYVGSVTINGFGGRVLEPAARRHIYAGAEIGWRAGP